MNRFNIPQSTISFISQFQKQLKGLVFIHKFLQVIVGGILPIIEAIIVNRATDSTNQNASYFWILLVIVGLVHLVFLIILVSTDTPLPQFLIEFDQLTDELAYAEASQAGLEIYNNTLRSAIIATRLSLIGIEKVEQEKIQEIDKKIGIILDTWIQNRSVIFWFDEGDAKYNFAVYLATSKNTLDLFFRQCDDRIVRRNRSWKKGLGHIGMCFAREANQFCQDAASEPSTTNDQVSRPEDDSYYKSIIAEPIMVNGEVIGVFIVTSSQADQFQEDIHTPCVRVIVRLLACLDFSAVMLAQNP
jgi:GAF domain-containing protein